tara:strand:+ start:526 stop:792 length:267 start_codon:yes stop_codon:yes gene_type:complete
MAALTIGTPALNGAVTTQDTSKLQPTSLSDISIAGYASIWDDSISRVSATQINTELPGGITLQTVGTGHGVVGSLRPPFGQLYPRGTQ